MRTSTLGCGPWLTQQHQDARLVGRELLEDPAVGGVPVLGVPDVARALQQLGAPLAQGRRLLARAHHLAVDDGLLPPRRSLHEAAERLPGRDQGRAHRHPGGHRPRQVADGGERLAGVAGERAGLPLVGGGATDPQPGLRGGAHPPPGGVPGGDRGHPGQAGQRVDGRAEQLGQAGAEHVPVVVVVVVVVVSHEPLPSPLTLRDFDSLVRLRRLSRVARSILSAPRRSSPDGRNPALRRSRGGGSHRRHP